MLHKCASSIITVLYLIRELDANILQLFSQVINNINDFSIQIIGENIFLCHCVIYSRPLHNYSIVHSCSVDRQKNRRNYLPVITRSIKKISNTT